MNEPNPPRPRGKHDGETELDDAPLTTNHQEDAEDKSRARAQVRLLQILADAVVRELSR